MAPRIEHPIMKTSVEHDDLLACAVEAARAAGGHALANVGRSSAVAQRFAHDVKLELDFECQRKAEEVILHAFPQHKILGEEGGQLESGADFQWIIDPIDGTVNFSHGLPLWCSAVGVRQGSEVVAGAVYLPAMNECYTATFTGPALCNGQPIRPSETSRLEDVLILTGLPIDDDSNMPTLEILRALSPRVQKTRIMGAAAVDICFVACGRADAYFEYQIYLWDIAAAGLIARRAGARTEVIEQLTDVRCRFLVTNGKVHDGVKNIVRKALGNAATE